VPAAARRPIALLLALAFVAGGAACSKKDKASPRRATTTATRESVALKVLPAPGTPPLVAIAVQTMLRKYLADAIVAPLRSGKPAPDLGPLFTTDTGTRIRGFDRPALVSEGLPPARDGVIVRVATAGITPLLAGDQVPMVAAAIDLRLRARDVKGARVDVSHRGELVLMRDGSAWKIGGYDMVAVRDTPKGTTTSTAVKEATP
jgi:hypothetical protein